MAILESLTIALGTGITKYLVKEVLPAEWQDQMSEELIDLGLSLVKGKGHEPNPVARAIGIGARVYANREGQFSHVGVMDATSVRDIRQLLAQPSLHILALHESMSVPDLDALPRERGLAIYIGEGSSVYRYVPPTGIA